MRAQTTLFAALAAMALSASADAQVIGSFSWQTQPYCNVVTLTVIQQGPLFQLAGSDNLCGSGIVPVTGTAVASGASVALGLTVALSSGRAAQISAAINLITLSGTWSDADGNTGNFVFGGNTGGSPRPTPVSTMFAAVESDGDVAFGSPGVVAGPPFATGNYYVTFPRDISGCSFQATAASIDEGTLGSRIVMVNDTPVTGRVQVSTALPSGALNSSFYIQATCR